MGSQVGLILDTSILISAERGRFDLERFTKEKASNLLFSISAVTASELLHGVHRATPKFTEERKRFVRETFARTAVLPFDLNCARKHAELWADLEVKGQRIGAHDLIIAATALRHGFAIATLNEKEFSRVDGLTLLEARPYVSTPS